MSDRQRGNELIREILKGENTFLNKLDSYQLDYQKGSYWSDLRGSTLGEITSLHNILGQRDSAMFYENQMMSLDYIPAASKASILIAKNSASAIRGYDVEAFLDNSYRIEEYLKEQPDTELILLHLHELGKFYYITKNFNYANEVMEKAQEKMQGVEHGRLQNSLFLLHIRLLIAQDKYDKLLPILTAYSEAIPNARYYHLYRGQYYLKGEKNIPLAREEFLKFEEQNKDTKLLSEYYILRAELAIAEKQYSKSTFSSQTGRKYQYSVWFSSKNISYLRYCQSQIFSLRRTEST
jgi:hypothetical protein